jgi:hypothetical protein
VSLHNGPESILDDCDQADSHIFCGWCSLSFSTGQVAKNGGSISCGLGTGNFFRPHSSPPSPACPPYPCVAVGAHTRMISIGFTEHQFVLARSVSHRIYPGGRCRLGGCCVCAHKSNMGMQLPTPGLTVSVSSDTYGVQPLYREKYYNPPQRDASYDPMCECGTVLPGASLRCDLSGSESLRPRVSWYLSGVLDMPGLAIRSCQHNLYFLHWAGPRIGG